MSEDKALSDEELVEKVAAAIRDSDLITGMTWDEIEEGDEKEDYRINARTAITAIRPTIERDTLIGLVTFAGSYTVKAFAESYAASRGIDLTSQEKG